SSLSLRPLRMRSPASVARTTSAEGLDFKLNQYLDGRSGLLADSPICSTILGMADKARFRAVAAIDPTELAEFQSRIRKRYTDEQIVGEITDCAGRLGRSPTMREFAGDPETEVHPQTVIEHFGSWNAAKRAAG